MNSMIVEILATNENFAANGSKIDMRNFTGAISILDWNKGYDGGFYYENSQRVGFISEYLVTEVNDTLQVTSTSSARVSDCGFQYTSLSNGIITTHWVSLACYPANSYQWYYSEPYDYYAFVASNYGCEVTNSCVAPTSGWYYEPAPEPYYEWSTELELFQDAQEKIENISDYLKCFNVNSAASLSLYVDQPTANSRDTWSGFPTNPDVGHTFISITQDGYTRVLGFYPNESVNPFTSPTEASTLVNDSGHEYDIKMTTDLTPSELKSVLDYVNSYNNTYDLNNYNCTDFGIQCISQAGVSIVGSIGTWPGGSGRNPGDLGEDIRSMNNISNYTIDKSTGTSVSNIGNCN